MITALSYSCLQKKTQVVCTLQSVSGNAADLLITAAPWRVTLLVVISTALCLKGKHKQNFPVLLSVPGFVRNEVSH